jgi:hypothetical protein
MKTKCYLNESDVFDPEVVVTEFKIHCEILFELKSSIERYIYQKDWNVPFVDVTKTILFYDNDGIEKAVQRDIEMLENDYEELVQRLTDSDSLDASFDINDVDIFHDESPIWEEGYSLYCKPNDYHILDFGENERCELFSQYDGDGDYIHYCPDFQIRRNSFPQGCIIAESMIEPIQSIVGFDLTRRSRSEWFTHNAIKRSLM